MIEFMIAGPLMGAVRTTQRQRWVDPRYKQYEGFKARVRLIANTHSIPQSLDPEGIYSLDVEVWWKGKQEAEAHVFFGILTDALWPNTKRILQYRYKARERTAREAACVRLEKLEI